MQTSTTSAADTAIASGLQKVIAVQRQIAGIHPIFTRLYPVAVAEHDSFFIYDLDPAETRYVFVKSVPAGMFVPAGVRAAFPLEACGGKTACVVSPDVFGEEAGDATIFHEFVHCYQGETCEQKMKMSLNIAQTARLKNDYMWELNHAFPYGKKSFVIYYEAFQSALKNGNEQKTAAAWGKLKSSLSRNDYEYLVWQMWKEGFARFLENKARRRLGLTEISTVACRPYDRISFYTMGANYIEFLGKRDPQLLIDIEQLFTAMK